MFGRKSRALLQQLQEVTERMTELTRVVENLQQTTGHNSRINIEKLEIEQAFLDELVFRLESLDIEELSGSLNLGNNFSPNVNQSNSEEHDAGQGGKLSDTKHGINEHDGKEKAAEPRVVGELANGSQLKTTTTGYLMSL